MSDGKLEKKIDRIYQISIRLDEKVSNMEKLDVDHEERLRSVETWKNGHAAEHGFANKRYAFFAALIASSFSGFLVFVFNFVI